MAAVLDWKKVATAGPTADGREIPEQDLIDIADTYDTEEYTAVIWGSDPMGHSQWYGNFGLVHEVKLDKDKKGRTCLFAKMAPNTRLMNLHDQGQKLFTSIEIWPNFADSGKAYLTGIAVTDFPASLGTEARRQYCKNTGTTVLQTNEKFTLDTQSPQGNSSKDDQDTAGTDADLTLFKRFMSLLKGDDPLRNTPLNDDSNEDDEMTPEQFQHLLEAQQNTNQLLGTLAEKFTPLPASADGAAAGTYGADNGAAGANAAPVVTAEQFQQLLDGQKDLQTKFAALAGEQPGTNAGEHAGASDQSQGVVG